MMKKYVRHSMRRLGSFVTTFSRQLSCFFLVCLVLFSAGRASATVYQSGGKINAQDEISLNTHTPYYWPDQPNACATGTAQPINGTVSATASQADIAKIIIGIAKTDNLGQAGALIGLMVGLDESSLQIYASPAVPISETNPAWLALPASQRVSSANGTSVGVFQQQVTDDWSTYSNSISDSKAVFQLMDPAYSAEAFFGTPSGATISTAAGPQTTALQKGLQNVSGWQSMQPWVAAQKVQISGDPTGHNYEVQEPTATSLLNQYYAAAPAVPLPVPINGGTGTTATATGSSCGTAGTSTCTGTAAATSDASVGQNVVNCVMQECNLWAECGGLSTATMHTGDSTTQKYGQYDFYKYTACGKADGDGCIQPESCAPGGTTCSYETWCADFASWIYLQAGYPVTGSTTTWRLAAVLEMVPADATNGQTVLNGRFVYHTVGSGYVPKPGDAAIHGYSASGRDHINFVTAVKGSEITLIGGDQGSGTTAAHTIQLNAVTKPYTLNMNTPDADDPPLVGFMTPNIAAQ